MILLFRSTFLCPKRIVFLSNVLKKNVWWLWTEHWQNVSKEITKKKVGARVSNDENSQINPTEVRSRTVKNNEKNC